MKLSSKFQIMDKNDHVNHAKCPECNENYIVKTVRRLQDRADEHVGKDS